MTFIKPIETVYNGYRFRSRLEARWALYFDLLGIKYEYEPEGLVLNNGTYYLPDFYLPDFLCYFEVKRKGLQDTDEGEEAIWKISDGMSHGTWAGIISFGDPLDDNLTMFCQESDDDGGGSFEGEITIGFLPDTQIPCLLFYDDKKDRAFFASDDWDCIPEAITEYYGGGVYEYDDFVTERVIQARQTARQARFEHGETPQIKRPRSSGN